jgi:protein tyrosine/serine phosphatase
VFLPLNGKGIGKVEHFTKAVTKVAESARDGEPVLVHCHAGTQRTGGVVAAYRLLIEKRTPQFVMEELQRYGWNPRRDQILIDFVNAHLKEAATELVAAGCLDQVPQPLPVLR